MDLSGGQQQHVALGRALIRESDVFLMDEPLSDLDAKLRGKMRTEIQELQNELGITSIYVTHDQTEAIDDQIAVMYDGELQQLGQPKEIYRGPNNQFVAGFLGSPSMNFVETHVRADRSTVDMIGPVYFSFHREDIVDLDGRERVVVGVRPEGLIVVESGGFEMIVSVIEKVGDENILYTESDGAEIIARVANDYRPEVSGTVRLDFDAADLHLFNVDSGEALLTKVQGREESATLTQ